MTRERILWVALACGFAVGLYMVWAVLQDKSLSAAAENPTGKQQAFVLLRIFTGWFLYTALPVAIVGFTWFYAARLKYGRYVLVMLAVTIAALLLLPTSKDTIKPGPIEKKDE